ncbi:MAG: M20/M25/M40 family metallo-hydrolase [Acidobacteriota bacterium]|nr:M20/M25/M40 family metallo-hydrolase [Acidobacteriota bacterium]
MTFDTASSGSGIVAASITGEVAERLFALAGKDLEDSQAVLDTANPHATGFALDGVTVRITTAVERETRTGHNVVGVLRSPAAHKTPALLIGAHYDHLGEGRHGNSLARDSEHGQVHHGADDNASGVVGVLAIAEMLAALERTRDVVLAFWSGEELGLLGSASFVNDTLGDASTLQACLNLDMIGRSRDNRLAIQGVGSSHGWRRLIEQANIPVGFDLQLQDDPYLPTDSSSFNRVGVPCLNLFTGAHEDYHRPSDVAGKINYGDMERVVQLTANIGRRLVTRDEPLAFVKVEPRVQQGAAPAAVRAYTGTIPDYATEIEGLLLSGVIGGGPAEVAGLREGDVIVKFGATDITNIYDYTYALEAVKVGEPLTVVYQRDGEQQETVLTPTVRP